MPNLNNLLSFSISRNIIARYINSEKPNASLALLCDFNLIHSDFSRRKAITIALSPQRDLLNETKKKKLKERGGPHTPTQG